jgi:hypothetical protein
MNLFLDSMMYLDPIPVGEIDFRTLLDSASITVQVPRATFSILNELKGSYCPQVRSRAELALKFLESALVLRVAGQRGVVWQLIPAATSADMARHDLDPARHEDWFIAAALRCKSLHVSERAVVMTDDLRVQSKCRRLRIETLNLPFKYRHRYRAVRDKSPLALQQPMLKAIAV